MAKTRRWESHADLCAIDAKYGADRLIDLAHAEAAVVAKHRRPVGAVMMVEE